VGFLAGLVVGGRLDEKAAAAAHARAEANFRASADLNRKLEEEVGRRERAKEEEAEERLKKLSGNWISADGQKTAKLDYDVLEFGKTPDWPDLEGRGFLLSPGHLRFLTESGRYRINVLDDQPDTMIFFKQDRATKSLFRLALYREGSPFAACRPPLPDTPPPPKIQALLDLIPGIPAHESVAGLEQRMASVWGDKVEIIDWWKESGETDVEVDLGVDGQWIFQRSANQSGELSVFRLVRTWAKDRREKPGPMVERVVYPFYEFGKIITGPMQSHPAGEMREGKQPGH
jgi:hypothetical protein